MDSGIAHNAAFADVTAPGLELGLDYWDLTGAGFSTRKLGGLDFLKPA